MSEKLSTIQKALRINLDTNHYGTIAEIGAGQEVSRFFFQAGAAANTIAKTMSAYDMQISDSIYGDCSRYVSRDRVEMMIKREYELLIERLTARPADTTFFSFANTVAARGYKDDGNNHGWIGLKFQLQPHGEPNEIIIHVQMHDKTNQQQQAALGILGVNLIYGAYHHWSDTRKLIESLLDDLGWERIEIDYINVSGPQFAGVDNRLLILHLLTIGHTEAALFSADGSTTLASEFLYKKDVIALRGLFNPPTELNVNMAQHALSKFISEENTSTEQTETLFEMNIRPFMAGNILDGREILSRIDMFASMGYPVLVTRFMRYFRLNEFFTALTQGRVRFIVSVDNIEQIFDAKYYEGQTGGILIATGQLFSSDTKLYVYPNKMADGTLRTLDDVNIQPELELLYLHLMRNNRIIPIKECPFELPLFSA
ncbi:MAG: hypothetical protein L3J71_09245 [Victivallaceae bacterium]|nr:hypothetical protein [Victivallaceae bacterium]